MNRYNTKESTSKEKNRIPSISNNKINLSLLSENSALSKKLVRDTNKSRSSQNLTLKAINDLSLYVVNIPSMKDIKKSIEDYYAKNELKENKIPIPFVSPINFTTVKIQFPNEQILNGYKTYILFLKYEDPKFKQILVKKENLFKTIKKIKLKSLNLSDTSNSVKSSDLNENKEKKILVKNIIKLYQHNKLQYKNDNSSFSFNTLGLKKSSDGSDKLIVNYYKNQMYLRNSSPYFSEEDKRIQDERESRKKFMTPKGFCCSVGKYSFPPRYISNYVQMTPSENPLTYRFRPVNKLKWMTKKGFINA
jgi:hypothetical protein